MDILISMFSALIVIIAYCLGVWTGSHFYCPRAGTSGVETEPMKRNDPMDRKSLIRKEAGDGDNCLNRPARKEYEGFAGADNDKFDENAEKQKQSDAERLREFESDAERQRQFEEDLKAFEACMNYSAERAYDMLKGFSAE